MDVVSEPRVVMRRSGLRLVLYNCPSVVESSGSDSEQSEEIPNVEESGESDGEPPEEIVISDENVDEESDSSSEVIEISGEEDSDGEGQMSEGQEQPTSTSHVVYERSPTYSPTSPSFSPTSPSYSPDPSRPDSTYRRSYGGPPEVLDEEIGTSGSPLASEEMEVVLGLDPPGVNESPVPAEASTEASESPGSAIGVLVNLNNREMGGMKGVMLLKCVNLSTVQL